MIKGIKLPGRPLHIKCKLILDSCFGGQSESAVTIMESLILFSSANSITLTPDISKQISESAGVSVGSLPTHIFRLEKCGAFSKRGKTLLFHPVFNGINEAEKILISFAGEIKKQEN